jgi:Ni/Co efflux regulator RcnB
MKKSLFALALGAALVSTVAAASPFQYDEHHDQYDQDHGHPNDRDHHDAVVHDRGAHEGWYRKGGRVPDEYRDHRYVVENWHEYRLAPPRRDYQWVRSDNGEFLLVAISTGIIADIMLSH